MINVLSVYIPNLIGIAEGGRGLCPVINEAFEFLPKKDYDRL